MIAFVRKEVGKWKKDHFNLVSWTLERLCTTFEVDDEALCFYSPP